MKCDRKNARCSVRHLQRTRADVRRMSIYTSARSCQDIRFERTLNVRTRALGTPLCTFDRRRSAISRCMCICFGGDIRPEEIYKLGRWEVGAERGRRGQVHTYAYQTDGGPPHNFCAQMDRRIYVCVRVCARVCINHNTFRGSGVRARNSVVLNLSPARSFTSRTIYAQYTVCVSVYECAVENFGQIYFLSSAAQHTPTANERDDMHSATDASNGLAVVFFCAVYCRDVCIEVFKFRTQYVGAERHTLFRRAVESFERVNDVTGAPSSKQPKTKRRRLER